MVLVFPNKTDKEYEQMSTYELQRYLDGTIIGSKSYKKIQSILEKREKEPSKLSKKSLFLGTLKLIITILALLLSILFYYLARR